ncbi:MAG: hypothetical protein PHP44_08390 [Kiritimatiellae bacterium]|nr:hypothetical protein [Kiritimatiellia bacterium]MDD4736110.1 hypothetical protein [Kiritimatiellia bacterium]
MMNDEKRGMMRGVTGAGVWLLCWLAGAATVGASDAAAPSAINFQYQVQAANLGAVQKPQAGVKYTILGADKTTVLGSGTTTTYMDTNGVCNMEISDSGLKGVLTGSGSDERYIRLDFMGTSGSYIAGEVLRLVTAPYAYMADKLEAASGNFAVGGDLTVSGGATMRALSVDGATVLSGDLIVRGMNNTTDPVWVQTNSAANNTLEIGQNATLESGATFNADVTAAFKSTFHDNVTVGGDMMCSNGASVKGCSPGFGSIQNTQASGSPPNGRAGFLLIYMELTSKSTSGMTVTIDSTTYSLRNSQEATSASDDGYQSVSYTFFVRAGSSWTAAVVPDDDDDHVKPTYYWCDMF